VIVYAMSFSDALSNALKKLKDEEYLRNCLERDPASLLIRVRALEREDYLAQPS